MNVVEEKTKYSGYGYHGGGRKPKAEGGRTRNIGIRVSEAELAFFKQKAEELDLSLTDLFLAGVKKL